jgi:hypothetical protein
MKAKPTIIEPNTKFGEIIVLGFSHKDQRRAWIYNCKCTRCDRLFQTQGYHIAKGGVLTCGCSRTKHGWCPQDGRTKEWKCWASIKQRCSPGGKYFNKGVYLYEPWAKDFSLFIKELGKAPSKDHQIDRIDNNNGYFPGNIRWVSRKQNQRNRECTIFVEYQGRRIPLSELCDNLNIPNSFIYKRVRRGWSIEDAITKPSVHPYRRRKDGFVLGSKK